MAMIRCLSQVAVFAGLAEALSLPNSRSASAGPKPPPLVAASLPGQPTSFTVSLVRELPHEAAPFTQGLEFTFDGSLIVETSGSYPPPKQSYVRHVDPSSGNTVRQTSMGLNVGGGRFIEGIVQLQPPNGNWFASTFTDNVVVEYDHMLNHVQDHIFPHTGWGFTRNGARTAFLATNGSEHIMTLQPGSFHEMYSQPAMCLGQPVRQLNELEFVDDFLGRGHPALLGNIYGTRVVMALDPSSMQCFGAFHLEGLGETGVAENFGHHVANGVAFNPHSGSFMVTGKNWKSMFEVRLAEDPAGSNGRAMSLVKKRLNLAYGGA